MSPADSKSQRLPISAQKAGRTTFVVSFSWLPGQCKNYQQNSFLAPSPVELCMGCVWNILSPADSKSQRLPISAQQAGRTTFVVSFIWLPGQCKNYQQNSFLAPSPVELCMGCVWNILSPADSKSQRFPISAQKAGRTTFVVSFIWLPGQWKNYQQNSFLAPSPVELCMGCVWNILSPADSKSQRLPISAQRKQVEPLLWCLSSGYRGSGRTTNRTPFWHLPRWSCAWGVFGTFCHQPTPKVSDSPSQPSKQVEPLLWCLSAGYRGSGRTTNRTPFWHLPRWSCAWGVFGTFCHQPTPKVSDSPSQPRKQVEPLLWCLSAGYRGSVRTTNRTPFWHLPRWSCAWGVFGTFCHQPTPKVSDCPSQPRKQVEHFCGVFQLATGAV